MSKEIIAAYVVVIVTILVAILLFFAQIWSNARQEVQQTATAIASLVAQSSQVTPVTTTPIMLTNTPVPTMPLSAATSTPIWNTSDTWGHDISCSTGLIIENGIDLTLVQHRGGSSHRVTVIGLGDFDPVMAIRDANGNFQCNDNASTAATYSANLPTTGQANTSDKSAQVVFTNTSPTFADIVITVGGYGGTGGEFLIIIEGMVASSEDGIGDPFSLQVSPALLASGIAPTVYNIAVTNAFDAMITAVDGDFNVLEDNRGVSVFCNNAGNSSTCWGESTNLVDSYISRSQNRLLPGGNLDAMMTLPIDVIRDRNLNYIMGGNNSYGDYVAVFHLGTASER